VVGPDLAAFSAWLRAGGAGVGRNALLGPLALVTARLAIVTNVATSAVPRPDRTRWPTRTDRRKAALNAFEITFDGRLSAGRK
jgi:hypothetical protein